MAKVQFADKPPDGGWGWAVVAGTFVVHIVVVGSLMAFGVFFVEFRNVFQESAGITSFINSVLGAAVLMCAPFASALSNLTSCRTVVIASGVISALGLIVCYFAQTMVHLFIGMGLLTGFGFALMYSPSIAMTGRYFDKRHATANGIALSGTGIGILALAPLYQYLIDEFGWRGALLIIAGITLNGCVCGALLRPIHLKEDCLKDQEAQGSTVCQKVLETFDVTLLKQRPFVVYSISLFATSLGQSMIYVHFVAHAQSLGIEKTRAAFLLSVLGVTEVFSRPTHGWLSDRLNISKVYYYLVGLGGLAMANIAIPFGNSYGGLVACMVLYGFFSAIFYSHIAVLVRIYCGVSRVSGGLGWAFVFQGTAFLIGPPVAGWLYDATGNYNMSFYSAGIFIFLSVIVLMVNPCSTTRSTLGSGSGELPDNCDGVVVLTRHATLDADSKNGQANLTFQE